MAPNNSIALDMARAAETDAPRLRAGSSLLPGVERDQHGKPLLPIEVQALYAYGHLIRCTEQLLLDLFTQGLLSGTTHTCIGQELCQMAVVRALTDPRA